jgi:hypothetical protein
MPAEVLSTVAATGATPARVKTRYSTVSSVTPEIPISA